MGKYMAENVQADEKKLKIIQIGHANVPIDAAKGGCGGLEEVVITLDGNYNSAGHASYVVASADSAVYGTLLPTIPSLYGPGKGHLKADATHIEEGFTEHSRMALQFIRQIDPDIIHDHTGYHLRRSFSERLFDPSFGLRTAAEIVNEEMPPILNTVHGYVTPENTQMYEGFRELFAGRDIRFCAVSQFQRGLFTGLLDVDYVIPNAIDTDSYTFGPEGKGYVFTMSSIYPGKGTHLAIDTAKRVGKKIIVGGPYYHNQAYWEGEIAPRIDRTELDVPAERVEALVDDFLASDDEALYLGEIGAPQKRILYPGADAFYFPVTINETFGLVSAEANASGVPVITFLSGGVPEVVNNGVSGYTVKRGDEEQFYQAALKADQLSRQDCRDWVVANFGADRQAGEYLRAYKELISTSQAITI
jgi:glycosyltransferase involved in cell wall biosynthesis